MIEEGGSFNDLVNKYSSQKSFWVYYDKKRMNLNDYPCPTSGCLLLVHLILKQNAFPTIHILDQAFKEAKVHLQLARKSLAQKPGNLFELLSEELAKTHSELC